MNVPPFVAVDIGNTRLKLGLFADAPAETRGGNHAPHEPSPHAASPAGLSQPDSKAPWSLPSPQRTLSVSADRLDALAEWLAPYKPGDVAWRIGSVQRRFTSELLDWLRRCEAADDVVLLTSGDLPLAIDLPRPDRTGIDRLLGAVAANALRDRDRPAVVVDLGTAVTVDRISPQGHFCGGAILPGIRISAQAMHQFTDLLPLLDMAELSEPPSPVGTGTAEAMQSGLFWGVIGGVRELILRMSGRDPVAGMSGLSCEPVAQGEPAAQGEPPREPPPQVFLTGGAAPAVARLLMPDAQYLPDLTLQGVALTVQAMASSSPSAH